VAYKETHSAILEWFFSESGERERIRGELPDPDSLQNQPLNGTRMTHANL